MKTCFKCRRELPLSEFYAHPQMADGHLNKCKECSKRDNRANRRAKIRKYRAYDVERNGRPERADQFARARKQYRERYPERHAAHIAVQIALRTGDLTRQSCEQCGNPKTDAHHNDYAKPLEVRWLCRAHHRAQHGAALLESAS